MPPLALHGLDEGSLLAADEGACADLDVQVAGEAGAQDVLPQQALAAGLLDGLAQPLHRQGYSARIYTYMSLAPMA